MADASAPAPGSLPVVGAITELKVSGNLMTLDRGLYCLFQQPGATAAPADGSGLPGVRITLPPQAREGAAQGTVTIRGLHEDGWLGPRDGAALVRVSNGPAQILITVYQSPDHPPEVAPRLQVVPLAGGVAASAPAAAPARKPAAAAAAGHTDSAAAAADKDIVAHIQHLGDVAVDLGDWMGKPGAGSWIEGFAITPRQGLRVADIEYQAVLGKGWFSPWISDGKFCGSRAMALPLLGFNLRLRGEAAKRYECEYRACFVDGSRIGPVPAGKVCAAASLSPLEAFQIILRPKAEKGRAEKTGAEKKAPARRAALAKPAAAAARKAPAKAKPSGKTSASRKVTAKPAAQPARKRGR